jgi:subtilase family serine protease
VLATLTTSGSLAAVGQNGYYDHQTVTVNLPGNLAPGTYYIGGIADYNNHVGESNETNNTYNVVPITLRAPQSAASPQPDLSEYVAVDKSTVDSGGSITIDAYNMNTGNAVSPGSTAQIFLSTDSTITTSDTVLAALTTSGPLATVGQNGYYDHQTVTVNLPGNLAPGTYYIGGIADYNNQVSESNEGNNTYNVVQVTVPAPATAPLAAATKVFVSEFIADGSAHASFVFNSNMAAAEGSSAHTWYDHVVGNTVSWPEHFDASTVAHPYDAGLLDAASADMPQHHPQDFHLV